MDERGKEERGCSHSKEAREKGRQQLSSLSLYRFPTTCSFYKTRVCEERGRCSCEERLLHYHNYIRGLFLPLPKSAKKERKKRLFLSSDPYPRRKKGGGGKGNDGSHSPPPICLLLLRLLPPFLGGKGGEGKVDGLRRWERGGGKEELSHFYSDCHQKGACSIACDLRDLAPPSSNPSPFDLPRIVGCSVKEESSRKTLS